MNLKKLILIALKDLRLIFRDSSALVLMLLAPFVLTLGMGALTGRFSGSSNTGISDIPVVIVNQDKGELGAVLVDVFQSIELEELVVPILKDDAEEARANVDDNQVSAAIIIPEGFTESIIVDSKHSEDIPKIEFYGNPTQPTSAGVLNSILSQFTNEVEIGRVKTSVIIEQLISNGLITPEQARKVGEELTRKLGEEDRSSSAITIINKTADEAVIEFDILSYMAPGMAIMFLMFTVTYGGRSLLVENRNGTLPRMLVAPTSTANVLGGKGFGIFLTGVAQLAILIGGTSALFRLQWGDFLGVILLILAAAFGATGWGILLASILKTPGQVAVTGSAVMLLFGILGGSFFDLSMLPDWIQVVNKITPNAWAIDGFYILSVGGGLADIWQNLLALVLMGLALFGLAIFFIRKRGLARK
jgi:ABC-2 type transport system permease protein